MQAINPFRVAIVGSGPSGFYAAEALLQSTPEVAVDLIERLPVPFGLVRYGVAPDHQKLKEVTRVYTSIASDDRVNFIGNVNVGVDISIDELLELYDAIIVASGAGAERKMSIPGESLIGCHSAADFVGWYNGHPDHRHRQFDLSGEVAVIIGQGNVAIDVCRILAKSIDELRRTDIAEYALDVLAESHIKRIIIVGRRGPAQAKFAIKELRELGSLARWEIRASAQELDLDPVSTAETMRAEATASARNIACLRELSARRRSPERIIEFRFLLSPIEVVGRHCVEGVTFERNALFGEPFQQKSVSTGRIENIKADIIFRSIGYVGVPIPGLPFDASAGIIPNYQGRILGPDGVRSRSYVTGWIKRGATGIIGTNRVDSIETVASLLRDREREVIPYGARSGRDGLFRLLASRGMRPVSFEEWRAIDAEELRRGQRSGRVRSKITNNSDVMSIIATARQVGTDESVGRPIGKSKLQLLH